VDRITEPCTDGPTASLSLHSGVRCAVCGVQEVSELVRGGR
jgi:hypothetical protein